MAKFKQFFQLEKFKKDAQKALGLKHISFNNYVDRQNNHWFWFDEDKKFRKILTVNEKKQKYLEFLVEISDDESRLDLFNNTYKKIYLYTKDEYVKFFTPTSRELTFLKQCQQFFEKTENINANIFRGIDVNEKKLKHYKELYKSKKIFIYNPLKSISSWTYSKDVASGFGDVVFGANLKESKKFIDVNIYMKMYENINNVLEEIDDKIFAQNEKGSGSGLNFRKQNMFHNKFKEFQKIFKGNPHSGEKEVIIIGKIPCKVVDID